MKPNFSRISDFPGQLIILEGTDGSGKSTQAKKIKKFMKKQGKVAVTVAWKDAPHFRDFFLDHDNKKGRETVSPEAHLMLQIADMLYQIEKKVIPNLIKGHTVIMDRALPTIVIRWLSIGHTIEQIEKGLLWFTNTVYRDLFAKATTLFLSVSARKSLQRIAKRKKDTWDAGEGTLLSLQMINNLRYLPDGEKLTTSAKRRLVEKLQETYITSYKHYFAHHEGIIIDANGGKKEVFSEICEKLGWKKKRIAKS
jgi:thymidylate kinase